MDSFLILPSLTCIPELVRMDLTMYNGNALNHSFSRKEIITVTADQDQILYNLVHRSCIGD
ncbi:MAG: hypothetical protein AYK19_05565 [Theionarchaea archaeon DG-70-1]|nr:MAG: hypothetical protein AYK19_05565 [Theionarchaea archaeon DG-70-1]